MMEEHTAQQALLDKAKEILRQLAQAPDARGSYFAGLKIWVGASSHEPEIIELANVYRKAYEALGASIILGQGYFGPTFLEQLNDADLIIMFAATPGISAKALEICWRSHATKATTTDKLYVYMPTEYAAGFICSRLRDYNAKIRHRSEAAFCMPHDDLFMLTLNDICDQANVRRRQAVMRAKEIHPTIGIVTALPVEFQAMTYILNDLKLDPKRERNTIYKEYHHGKVKSNAGGHHDVVVARAGKGNNKAAVLATDLINQYPSIEELLMVGIAAGVPDVKNAKQHVRLGDIVVCNEHGVIQYDMVKKNTYRTETDVPPRPPSYVWLTRVENHIAAISELPKFWSYLDEILQQMKASRPHFAPLRDTPWVTGRKATRQPIDLSHDRTRPKIHCGSIGSANTVLKTAKIRDRLKDVFKIKAIEMEASGIAEATWQAGKGYFVIRGICDFANDDKNKIWQPYAAAAAAAFARELIETMPLISEAAQNHELAVTVFTD